MTQKKAQKIEQETIIKDELDKDEVVRGRKGGKCFYKM